jgi:hypothetical protein
VAPTVALLVVADGALAVAPARDDGNGAGVADRAAQAVGVVTLVGEQLKHAAGTFEECWRGLHVADVAGSQHQRIGATDDVGERVDLGRPAAARAADRLCRAPLFAPNAARYVFT